MHFARLPIIFVCLAAWSPLHAEGNDGRLWAGAVQSRIMHALGSPGRHAPTGRAIVHFTIGADGEVSGLHAEGAQQAARLGIAAVRAMGRAPTPPDHRAHTMSIPIAIR